MKSKKIMVIGSYNVGLSVFAPRIPSPGETVLGSKFDIGPGGKGSNQAIGIKRLGGEVYFVGKIGNDIFAEEALSLFSREGLDTRFVFKTNKTHTGAGIISIDTKGENAITVAPGANFHLTPDDIEKTKDFMTKCHYLLIQLEIPLVTVEKAVTMAKSLGVTTILNPAPACKLPKKILSKIDIITPNRTELEILTNLPTKNYKQIVLAGKKLLETGVPEIIITCGKEGSLLIAEESISKFPGYKVNAIDTTGAGDTFNAGLVYALSQNFKLPQAIDFANKAGALATTKRGVVPGLPTMKDIQRAFV